MCFSANASFGASAILLVAGVVSVKKVKTPSQIPFAAIPLVFATQQFIEGVLWLSLTTSQYAYLQQSFTYIFLTFAEVLWPIWVPLSIGLIEKEKQRKKILLIILIIGIVLGVLLSYSLLTYPVDSSIDNFHIRYRHHVQHSLINYVSVFYFAATVLPALISSVKKVIFIGGFILISYIVTKVFFEEYVISIWCFFAAAISVLILIIMQSFNPAADKIG